MGDDYLIDCDLITRGRFLGKGAFGAVYAGTMLDKVNLDFGFHLHIYIAVEILPGQDN